MVDLFIPLRPHSLNAERKANHWERSGPSTAMRTLAAVEARKISRGRYRLLPVLVVATPVQKGTLADTGNHYPSVKAAVDGLVDAGWFTDDTLESIGGILLAPPRRPLDGEPEGLWLSVEPMESHPTVQALTGRQASGKTGPTPAQPVPPKGPTRVPNPPLHPAPRRRHRGR